MWIKQRPGAYYSLFFDTITVCISTNKIIVNHWILKITWSNILQIQWSWLFGIWSLTSGFEKIWEKVKILYRFNDPLMHGSWLQLSVMHEIEYCGITSFIYGYTMTSLAINCKALRSAARLYTMARYHYVYLHSCTSCDPPAVTDNHSIPVSQAYRIKKEKNIFPS